MANRVEVALKQSVRDARGRRVKREIEQFRATNIRIQ